MAKKGNNSIRKLKANADYFPHPAGFRNRHEIKYILQKLGPLYHSILINLLEIICESNYLKIHISEKDYLLYALDFNVSKEEIEKVILEGEKWGIFLRHNDELLYGQYDVSSPLLEDMLIPLFNLREKNREAQQNRSHRIHKKTNSEPKPEELGIEVPEQQKDEEEHAILTWVKKHAPRVQQLKTPLTNEHCEAMYRKYPDKDFIKKMLLNMHNYKPLLANNIDAYLTFMNWANKEWVKISQAPK